MKSTNRLGGPRFFLFLVKKGKLFFVTVIAATALGINNGGGGGGMNSFPRKTAIVTRGLFYKTRCEEGGYFVSGKNGPNQRPVVVAQSILCSDPPFKASEDGKKGHYILCQPPLPPRGGEGTIYGTMQKTGNLGKTSRGFETNYSGFCVDEKSALLMYMDG